MSTELKSCLLGILGDNNYYSHYYTYFFHFDAQKHINMQIRYSL